MDRNERVETTPGRNLGRWVGVLGPALLVGLSVVGSVAGVAPKLLGISWVAFGAMAGAIPLGRRASRKTHARGLVWGYGLASGAMITSAAVFLLPDAIGHHAALGGFGVAVVKKPPENRQGRIVRMVRAVDVGVQEKWFVVAAIQIA